MPVPRILLVAGSDLASGFIEWFGGGGWSHYANVLADDSIIDARADVVRLPGVARIDPGVQRRPAHYLDSSPKWMLLEVGTETQYPHWESALVSQLHKPYDFIGIADFATGAVLDRNWRDEAAWFCDELGVWAEEEAGICPRLPDPIFRVTPGAALLLNIGLGARVVGSRG